MVNIWYFHKFSLFLTVPLHHFGCLILVESGFLSYRTLIPTSNFGNSLPLLVVAVALTFINQCFNLWLISIYFDSSQLLGWICSDIFLIFNSSTGLLLILGIHVALKISIANHVFSGFLVIIWLTVWTILSTGPTDWWLYALEFSVLTLIPKLLMEIQWIPTA